MNGPTLPDPMVTRVFVGGPLHGYVADTRGAGL